jgi:hypothetical protein
MEVQPLQFTPYLRSLRVGNVRKMIWRRASESAQCAFDALLQDRPGTQSVDLRSNSKDSRAPQPEMRCRTASLNIAVGAAAASVRDNGRTYPLILVLAALLFCNRSESSCDEEKTAWHRFSVCSDVPDASMIVQSIAPISYFS